MHNLFPGIVTRSLSATYNCFGLVFSCRRAFVFEESVELILNEDDYTKISREDVFRGDLVVYRSEPGMTANHVGIVFEVRPLLHGSFHRRTGTGITVLSQWGQNGEYLHLEHQVPADYGPHIEYYTDRRLAR
jgi:hypothetical protein